MALGHNSICECVECSTERLGGGSSIGRFVVEIRDRPPVMNGEDPVPTIDEEAFLDVARMDWLDDDYERLNDVRGHVSNEGGTVRDAIDHLAALPILSGEVDRDEDSPEP